MTIQRTHWHCPLVSRPHTPHSRGHIYCFFPFFSPLDDWKWVLLAFLVMAKKNPKMPNSGTILRLRWHSHLVLHPCTPKLRYHQNSFFDMWVLWYVGFFPCKCDCECANVVQCAIWVCLCVYTWLWLSTCNCGCLLAISVASECICVCVRICACLSHVLRRKKSHQKAHRDSFPCSSIQKLHSNTFLISTKFTWSKSDEFSLSRNGLVVRRRCFRF